MFCKNCGAPVGDTEKYCSTCGTPIVEIVPVPVAPAVESTPILVFGILSLAFACSFFAAVAGIVFGCVTANKVNAFLAAGGQLSGKAKVGSILGKVGKIVGIVMSILCAIYFTGLFIALVSI